MKAIFEVDENYMMWGFRYALGRRTGAVLDACDTLKRVWKNLEPHTKYAIHAEITEAIERDRAGSAGYICMHDCDVESWKEILNLEKGKE